MTKLIFVLVFSVAICAASTMVLAQAEHAEAAEAQHEESTFHVVARWANFAVLFGGLAYLLRKPMLEFFQLRRHEITTGLERAQNAQTSAQSRIDEIEQRLAHLSTDIATLRAEAEKESQLDRERILAEAKHEVERVIEQSRQEIERVARTIEHQIKESMADLVVDRAGNTLRTEMTQDDQKRVVVRFIKTL